MAMTPHHGHDRQLQRKEQSLSVFDPFEHFGALWSNSEVGKSFASDMRAVAGTRVDWKETADAHVFKADLPGLTKEEVKVTVEDGNTLQITGERSKEGVDRNDKWHRVERSQSRFLRRFRLPDNTNIDAVNAKVSHGVLTVTVPKKTSSTHSTPRCIDVA
jgi:HSP20 family protein